MSAKRKKAQKKLEVLAEHLREGWRKQHPLSEEFFTHVRESVREQWQEEQAKLREEERLKEEKARAHEHEQEHEQDDGPEHDQEQSY